MVRLGDLPDIHQREEEEEGDTGDLPDPQHGAGRGQGAAGNAEVVEGAGRGNGNVTSNTLGGSDTAARRVIFSPDSRTRPGRGGHMLGQRPSPGRGARPPQGRGRGSGPHRGHTQAHSTHHAPRPPRNDFFRQSNGQAPPWSGEGSSYDNEAGRQWEQNPYSMIEEQLRATRGPSGQPQWQQQQGRGVEGQQGAHWGEGTEYPWQQQQSGPPQQQQEYTQEGRGGFGGVSQWEVEALGLQQQPGSRQQQQGQTHNGRGGFGGISPWEGGSLQQQPQQRREPGRWGGASSPWGVGAAKQKLQLQQWRAPGEQRHPGPARGWEGTSHSTALPWGACETGGPQQGNFGAAGGALASQVGPPPGWGGGVGSRAGTGTKTVASFQAARSCCEKRRSWENARGRERGARRGTERGEEKEERASTDQRRNEGTGSAIRRSRPDEQPAAAPEGPRRRQWRGVRVGR